MLHLHFAPSLDLLVPELLARMLHVWKDPFVPPAVIVPNPAVGTWLKLRLADCPESDDSGKPLALGCTANLPMPTLERFLWKVLRPDDGMRLLDVAVLSQVICALLEQPLLNGDRYASLRSYLSGPGGIDPVKRVQLASRIAHGFLEYEYNRPSVWDARAGTWRRKGIDASWLEDRCPEILRDCPESVKADEKWQRDLYRRAHACLDASSSSAAGSDPERFLSLPHLYRERREAAEAGIIPWDVPAGTIFLFGVAKVSHFHRNTLVELSQSEGVDLQVLLTNPCAEFWEDVDTWRNRRYRRRWSSKDAPETAGITARRPADYDQSELTGFGKEPRLLELWGAAGKEDIYLWCPEAEWNFEYTCPAWVESEEPPGDLLHALQYALLRRESDLPERSGGWGDDGTLRILAGPDPGREIEELREQILDLVKDKKIRCLNEIAVYLPDPSAYLPSIERVFGAFEPSDPAYIPFNVLGAPGTDSRYARGISAFLDIMEYGLDRAVFFALLRNPVVRATRAVSREDIAVWEQWAEEMGIYRGYDKAHRQEMGDAGQAATDAHTFELGAVRLLIGGLAADPVRLRYELSPEDSGAGHGPSLPIPPYRDFGSSEASRVEQFCALAELLRDDTRAIKAALREKGIPAAVGMLLDREAAWFRDIPDDAGRRGAAEGRVRRDFLDAAAAISLQSERAGRREITLQEFVCLVRGCLPGEVPAHSRAWTGGITFAPLRPAMVLPHRVIFVLGLDAAAFPGTNDKPGWNLLLQRRLVGDGDEVRDNRFLFLDLVHAARERLVLSYRARDMQKEEERQPSSVLLELESYCASQGLKQEKDGKERCTIRHEIPWLVREEPPEKRTWDPSEARLRHLVGGRRALHRYGTDRTPPAGRPVRRVNGADAGSFFANPFEYHLSKTLGIELDDQPATMGAADEPLASGAREISSIQKAVMQEILSLVFPEKKQDGETGLEKLNNEAVAAAGRLYDRHIASGRSPEAQLCTMERRMLLSWAGQCPGVILPLREQFPGHVLRENVDLSLGRPEVPPELRISLGAEELCAVEGGHRFVLFPRDTSDPGGAIGIIAVKKEGEAADNPELWLSGVLQWITEKKIDEKGLRIRLVQLNRGGLEKKKQACSVSVMKDRCEQGDINAWLAGLLSLMIRERCSDHLPFTAVRNVYSGSWDAITRDALAGQLESEHGAYRCFLEAFKLTDARLPQVSDRELRSRAKARFAPLLERWLHE